MRIGSLFSGAGGLDMAVEAVFGGRTVWQAELAPGPCKVLDYRWPAPNIGDITKVDWVALKDGERDADGKTLADVDILCGGFPCQDVSSAGRRAGIKDGTRSGLWSIFAEAIDALRPQYVVIENVRGLLSALAHRAGHDDFSTNEEDYCGDSTDDDSDMESAANAVGDRSGRPVLRAIGAVLGDLSDLGYDAQWTTISAASVGAPHRRDRVFILATGSRRDGRARGPQRDIVETARIAAQLGDDADRRAVAGSGTDGSRSVEPLLPTPRAGEPGSTSPGYGNGLAETVESMALLPTPAAGNFNDGESPESWRARQATLKQGYGLPLAIAVQELLPTPTAAHGPPLHKGGNLTLSGAIEGVDSGSAGRLGLLPTPQAWDGNGYVKTPEQQARQSERGYMPNLGEVIENEIVAKSYERPNKRNKVDPAQSALIEREADTSGPMLGGGEITWGKYEFAIRRWEGLTRSAPMATELNGNGKPKLAAAFAEWLMGWPAGWVTEVPGVTRNEALKIAGNGVVPQQAAAALRYLLAIQRVAE